MVSLDANAESRTTRRNIALSRPRLLQVCNVGQIVGGTAACAWTVTRALPEFEHHVWFFSPPDRETVAAFSPCQVCYHPTPSAEKILALRPQLILLHNTSRTRWPHRIAIPTVLYLHSAIRDPAQADRTMCCSHWLAQQLQRDEHCVVWQAVPKSRSDRFDSCDRERTKQMLTVGRICTPIARKWPRDVIPFYEFLAWNCPSICWEFVGCPTSMQGSLWKACRGRAEFYPAGWHQRARLRNWDVLLYSNPRLPESFGRTVAEAMRVGCIPVVDRLGGFLEQVVDGSGFLCGNRNQFAFALKQLADEDVRRSMSERAQLSADERFSLARFSQDFRTRISRITDALGPLSPSEQPVPAEILLPASGKSPVAGDPPSAY